VVLLSLHPVIGAYEQIFFLKEAYCDQWLEETRKRLGKVIKLDVVSDIELINNFDAIS
jgi:hypothetical protein